MQTARQGRVAFALATAAVGWAALLIIAVVVAPAYSEESREGGSGVPTTCAHRTQTFVHVNGVHSLLLLGWVCAIAVAGWLLLHARCASGLRGAAGAAQVCAGVLLAFGIVASFSIGSSSCLCRCCSSPSRCARLEASGARRDDRRIAPRRGERNS